MKLKNFIDSLDADSIKQRLNDLDLILFKLELSDKKPNFFDKPIYGKSDIHSQILKEVAYYINSVEIIPNSTYSFTINITIK